MQASRRLLVVASLTAMVAGAGRGAAADAERQGAEAHFAAAAAAFDSGALARAVEEWRAAAEISEREGCIGRQIDALLRLGHTQTLLGLHADSLHSLEHARQLTETPGNDGRRSAVLAGLGEAAAAAGEEERARDLLGEALAGARDDADVRLQSAVLAALGSVLLLDDGAEAALPTFQESVRLARRTGDHVLAARGLGGAAEALIRLERFAQARALLDASVVEIEAAPPTHVAAYALLDTVESYRTLPPDRSGAEPPASEALDIAERAASMAERIGDARASSYAWGAIGAIHEEGERMEPARAATLRAILALERESAPEALYRWEWQLGRILRAAGEIDHAIAAHQRAIRTLQPIREKLTRGRRSRRDFFARSVRPLFVALADLLLRKAAAVDDPILDQAYLAEVRSTMESLKAAELQEYFGSGCVAVDRPGAATLDRLTRDTLVVYPIILPDRLELLSSAAGLLRRVTVPVSEETLTAEVRALREALEEPSAGPYVARAQLLYDWLVRPIEPELARDRPDTLVFVPSGPLLTIPLAALHDGEKHLVERYAIAVTPGLELTDPRPFQRDRARLLLAGITEAVFEFPALPAVSQELEIIRGIFGGTILLNDAFRVAPLREALSEEDFTILHIASHAQFRPDVDQTFLLTYGDRVSMDQLEAIVGLYRFRDQPLDLLALSACETAAGDDRAALGLAGVAVKAGAKSVLATLWSVNDRATAALVGEFYRQLHDPSVSKAAALQRAQQRLLASRHFRHPAYWSPFLLINNWR